MEDIIDIIVTETTNTIEITSQASDEIIDVNIIDNREDVTLNVTPSLVEININSLTGNFGVEWGEITGTLADQTDLNTALGLKADLVGGKVPSSQLPSYVDDVVEVANYAALPATGETGKIYITLDTNKIYRWSGSAYIEIADSTAVWGAITGTLSSQTDLQSALDAKIAGSGTSGQVSFFNGTSSITGESNLFWDTTNNRLGVNESSPTHSLHIVSSAQCPALFKSTTAGGGIALMDSTTGNDSSVGIGAFGDNLCFRAGGDADGNMRLHSTGNFTIGGDLSDDNYLLDVRGTARLTGALNGTSANFSGSVTSSSFVKSGGTSAQFLKANGSVDSTAYLPLTGGTLTGGLNGTFGNFSSYVNAQTIDLSNSSANNALRITHTNTSYHAVSITATGGSALYATGSVSVIGTLLATGVISAQSGLSNGTGQSFALPTTSGTLALTSDLSAYLPLSGGTLTGALSGTSASFSGNMTIGEDLTLANLGTAASNILATSTSGILSLTAGASSGYTGGGTIELVANDRSGTNTRGEIYISAGNASANTANGFIALQTANTERLRVTYAGNVGIGTTAPSDKLNVVVGSNGNIVRFDGPTSGLIFQTNATTTDIISYGGSTPAYRALNFSASASTNMTITTAGNVGIGTTAPTTYSLAGRHLELNDSGGGYAFYHCNTTNVKSFFATNESAGLSALFTYSNHALTFGTNNTERMRITSGGSVLIGTSSVHSSAQLLLENSLTAVNQIVQRDTQSATYTDVWYQRYINSGFTLAGGISHTGATTVSFVTSSDYRLKKDVQIMQQGLERLMQIKPVTYKWIEDDSFGEGFIAHELQEIVPLAVVGQKDAYDKDGRIRPQSVDYSKVVPILVKSIQELKAKIDILENK